MQPDSKPLVLSNARLVLADRVIDGGWIAAEDGMIVDFGADRAPAGAEDVAGDFIIPGLIELHTDHLEAHYMPRPKVYWDPVAAVVSYDAQLASCGITTVLDSLRVWREEGVDEVGGEAALLAAAIATARDADMLRVGHFLHLRCEVPMPDVVAEATVLIGWPEVRLVSLMDHTPGQRQFRDQDPVNIEATELMGKLHDRLKDTGYEGHDLERFLVRVLFCLFADSTGIFEPPGIFTDLVRDRTRQDGSDLGGWLSQLFEVLNTPDDRRHRNLDEDLTRFPYINGDLFQERLAIPSFDSAMREALLEVCSFSWEQISPAIFGSLFQSVMDKQHRRAQGAHYTTEKNIMKVIQPLFLDDLYAEFEQLKKRRDTGRSAALRKFHQNLGSLKFFDPACGCGNFLIIAYRELRLLEIEILKVLRTDGQLELDVSRLSKIDVDQFFGMELSEFPARIGEVAMWMMDHIMNNRLSLEFGDSYLRIPLKKSPHIRPTDALETDWESVLPAADCS